MTLIILLVLEPSSELAQYPSVVSLNQVASEKRMELQERDFRDVPAHRNPSAFFMPATMPRGRIREARRRCDTRFEESNQRLLSKYQAALAFRFDSSNRV